MEHWKKAYEIADIVVSNSRVLWIVYLSFFIAALKVRKSENKTRWRVGGVMIGASVPGLFISIGTFGLFAYTMIRCYMLSVSSNYNRLIDLPEVQKLQSMCNYIPIMCVELSMFLFFVLAVIAAICGIVILGRRAGTKAGVCTLIYGLCLTGFAWWFMNVVFLFMGT